MRADYTYFPFTEPEKLTYKYKDCLPDGLSDKFDCKSWPESKMQDKIDDVFLYLLII